MLVEGLNVVSILTPDPRWIFSWPAIGWVPFGKHVGKAERIGFTDVIRECGGELKIHVVGPPVQPDAPPDFALIGGGESSAQVQCSQCTFSFFLNREDWYSGVFEWMKMAFGMALIRLNEDRDLFEHLNVWWQIKVCLPHGESVFSREIREVLGKYSSMRTWGVWRDFGIMVGLSDAEEIKSLKFLIVGAGIMLTQMEKLFQDNIEKAAQLASSASESFHSRTRRPKR